jgi:hypothetical protein
MQKTLSDGFEAEISPYPTVVIVVTQKYIAIRYVSLSVKFWNENFPIQVPVP